MVFYAIQTLQVSYEKLYQHALRIKYYKEKKIIPPVGAISLQSPKKKKGDPSRINVNKDIQE